MTVCVESKVVGSSLLIAVNSCGYVLVQVKFNVYYIFSKLLHYHVSQALLYKLKCNIQYELINAVFVYSVLYNDEAVSCSLSSSWASVYSMNDIQLFVYSLPWFIPEGLNKKF